MQPLTKLKRFAQALVLCSLVFFAACDPPDALVYFQVGLEASTPLLQSLVTSHKLTQEQVDVAKADVQDSVKVFDDGQRCVKSITVTGDAKKVAKARCYFTAATQARAILNRHHLEGNETLDSIYQIAEGGIRALETYYNAVTSTETAGKPKQVEDPDKVLNQAMKDMQRKFEGLMSEQ